jgi:type IV pilus assembly protein PilQ
MLQREKAQEKKEEMATAYITVNYKDVGNIRTIIEGTVKSQEGRITVDTPTKTIILYDRLSKLEEAKDLVKRLDQPTPQVMIEARIVEASTRFSRSLGVQWDFEQQQRNSQNVSWSGTPSWAPNNVEANLPSGGNLYTPTFSTGFSNTAFPGSTLGLAFSKLSSFGLTGTMIDAQIALSEAEGETKILSAPKIVTRDTVPASIQQGTKIVIPSGTDANGNMTFQQVDASLKLEVTPQITPNDMVIMQVSISDDNPDYANARGDNVPINTKNATSTMMVKSGETVVIGGIFKENKGLNEEGIPGLSKIPILGWLFKARTKTNTQTELMIFITPTVLPSL